MKAADLQSDNLCSAIRGAKSVVDIISPRCPSRMEDTRVKGCLEQMSTSSIEGYVKYATTINIDLFPTVKLIDVTVMVIECWYLRPNTLVLLQPNTPIVNNLQQLK